MNKRTPKTHQTRCGVPWQGLGVDNGRGGLVFKAKLLGADYENVFVFTEDGLSYHYGTGRVNADVNLTPIVREHNLPTDLPMAAQWAAKDSDGVIYVYNEKGASFKGGKWAAHGRLNKIEQWLYSYNMLAEFEPEDSLHKRLHNGGWQWAGK